VVAGRGHAVVPAHAHALIVGLSVGAAFGQSRGVQSKILGFLGAGNMAAALVKGLIVSGTTAPERIWASDVKAERLAHLKGTHGIHVTQDNHELVRACDVLVLSVKPQVVDKVLDAIRGDVTADKLVVSVAAGVPLSALEARLPGARVVRSMPNTPATALAGATAISAGALATAEDMETAEALFAAVGRVVTLDESLLDAVTGLSGSGPAYVMLIIEALADGGVKVGLHRDTALLLAAQTVFGSAKLLLETGEHPGRLKDMVTSPGGTAIAGLHTLESGALRKTLIDAVEAATARAAALGEQMAKKMGAG
jgi:pyrroline-5-carboxylate reductase